MNYSVEVSLPQAPNNDHARRLDAHLILNVGKLVNAKSQLHNKCDYFITNEVNHKDENIWTW